MKWVWFKVILGVLCLGMFALCGWLIVENIRYHYFPIPYEIIARGQLPYEDPLVNEVTLWVVSSESFDDMPLFPSEIKVALNQVDLQEKIAVVIENQVHVPYTETSPDIRRVIDISKSRIHIESLLYRSPNSETSPTRDTYEYLILTFDKRDYWEDEIEFYLSNDEQTAAHINVRIR